MQSRRLAVALVGAAALAVPAVAAAAPPELFVTGGGQTIFDDQFGRSGDTIAFNAKGLEAPDSPRDAVPAKGELQVVNRIAGYKYHGDVTCIRRITIDGVDYIRFGGLQKVNGKGQQPAFTVDVRDNGTGPDPDDDIFFRVREDEPTNPCDRAELSTELRNVTLARGNVTDHSS